MEHQQKNRNIGRRGETSAEQRQHRQNNTNTGPKTKHEKYRSGCMQHEIMYFIPNQCYYKKYSI
ncbi:hypothetical protein [Virgibacillus doumboii]|uniref:hypothetical protein n=1 Tax=Virgibacillus doumboii TaxID=2697503 RepID=UPI0013DFB829|nr:hypothetical protein [Virgibacillus doumboii]